MVKINFNEKLKELRLRDGLTQKQLASLIGTSNTIISSYELQDRYPSPEVVIKLAAVFHVSMDYLLGLKPQDSIDVSDLKSKDIRIVQQLVTFLREKNAK